MFRKILIANRGEIACRIIRTCQRMGIKTVAVYSQADENALHARLADEAHYLGASAPKESYLHSAKILQIARDTSTEAIHPGYGFLSQSPAFARECEESGICFIGPKADVMQLLGDKLEARKLAKKARVDVLPGTDYEVDAASAKDAAGEVGFPLMIKAAEGGGGIGIYAVQSMDQLMPLMERASQTVEKSFGSSRLYFERQLEDASHIEVQIIGDEYGNVIHLHERDCSIQRRNQKVIEETPAVRLTEPLRRKICNLAVRFARFVKYSNAGTVEFLVSGDGQIYFLEINTRLQVEHGVTELVTGVDLVELQLRIAAGEHLLLCQKDIKAKGHAIEARIYPEDPETFLPDVGTITELHEPSGEHVRVDSALWPGYKVLLDYESLLAKVMASGESREEAIDRLLEALLNFRIEGVKCNIPLLRDVLMSPDFRAATHDTGFLADWMKQRKEQSDREVAAAIGTAVALAFQFQTKSGLSVLANSNPWREEGRRAQTAPFVRRGWGRSNW